AREKAKSMDLADDEWVWVTSRNGRIKVQVRLMDGVNPKTVWTWNAIGKRSGAWNLKAGGREAKSGFLMNHLIDELLPEQPCGYRFTNSDPVTGQAAWYDLRVRVEKADQNGSQETYPQFPPLSPKTQVSERVDISRFGESFSKKPRRNG
ncbi:MAG TPA: formate dehydrogenase, partial [Rhodospirillaceae bacterium]|nr:formate dehydrogenase [Rhodospirillaceae bacterium]